MLPSTEYEGKAVNAKLLFMVGSPPKIETLFLLWPWCQAVWFCENIFFFIYIYISHEMSFCTFDLCILYIDLK